MAGRFGDLPSVPPAPAPRDGVALIDAPIALAILRTPVDGFKPDPSVAPLRVESVELGDAVFRTDRGPQRLPAWLFHLAGAASPAAVPAWAPPRVFRAPVVTHASGPMIPLQQAHLSADGSVVTLDFVGGPAGSGSCTNDYVPAVAEGSMMVAVRVVETRSGGGTCKAMGYPRTVSFALVSPLGNRVPVDDGTGSPLAATS